MDNLTQFNNYIYYMSDNKRETFIYQKDEKT